MIRTWYQRQGERETFAIRRCNLFPRSQPRSMHANPLVIPTVVGAAALFWSGYTLEQRADSTARKVALWAFSLIFAIPGMLFVLYYVHLFDSAAWFYNLRILAGVEVASCGLGLVAGVTQRWWGPESFGERAIVPTVFLMLVLIPFVKPMLDPLDVRQLQDRFEGDVCLQSTFSTCGPASAVTLLRSFGANSTEKQFALECFTSRGGTEIWYLARALRRRGYATSVVIQKQAGERLPAPAIAGVVLRGGAGHFIAVLSSKDDSVTIADPLKGKFVLTMSELQQQYHFTGFFLLVHPG